MKQAVILAAGQGRRLGKASNGSPKCLVRIGDRRLIDLQLAVLDELEVQSVVVLAGYGIEELRQHLQDRSGVVVVENPRFAETNSLYSLWLARDWVTGPFVCLNGDVLAHPDVFRRVLAVNGCALAYDSGSGREDEHMKVDTDGRYLTTIGKKLALSQVNGENVGLLQFDARGTMALFKKASQLVHEGGENEWAPRAVGGIAPNIPIRCVDVAGLPWTEIDFPEDLERARAQVWPAIAPELGVSTGLSSSVGYEDSGGGRPFSRNAGESAKRVAR